MTGLDDGLGDKADSRPCLVVSSRASHLLLVTQQSFKLHLEVVIIKVTSAANIASQAVANQIIISRIVE